jgi:hypothetical protein
MLGDDGGVKKFSMESIELECCLREILYSLIKCEPLAVGSRNDAHSRGVRL